MNKIKLFAVLGLCYLGLLHSASAQPPDPGGNPVYDEPALGGSAPIDGGLHTLLLMGIAWASWKKYKSSAAAETDK